MAPRAPRVSSGGFRQTSTTHRRGLALAIESLEARKVLSADFGFAAESLVRQIEWQGRSVAVHADSWIVRSVGSLDASAFASQPGWRMASLGEGFFSVVAPGASSADVLGWARGIGGVSYVEPDFAIAPTALPNDTSFGSLWGLHNIGQSGGVVDADIDAPEAWNTSTGSRSVVVAVIDTGIDYTHADLAANAWRNPGEVAGDGIDNDRNGFVDDVHGYDFVNRDGDPMDDNSHGTHVAGTIGAVGDNGTGVTGVNWQVSIMGLKFLSASGSGSTSDAIAAVNYATRMRRDFGINIVATNNSWGGGGFSTALRDAIEAGGRAGILFVAAAGNETNDNDASPSYPANYTTDAVISVAATTRSNQLASFSNYGATSVDIAAPGSSISSTVPGNGYASYSGTSMATPHVTGAIALLAAANPQASAAQLRSAVLSSAVPVPSLAGKVATGGLLNVAAALQAIGSQPPVDPPPVDPPPTDPPGDVSPPEDIVDVGDSLRTAAAIGNASGSIRLSGNVGDGSSGSRDVDLYRVSLRAGQQLVIDVDARDLAGSSTLDSYLRLFDAQGRQLAANDDMGDSFDSYLTFTARQTGVYYVGISGFGNQRYLASRAGSGRDGSIGFYQVALDFGTDVGDTIADATPVEATSGSVRVAGAVGDNGYGTRDVDMYRVSLRAGQQITIDIDARSLPTASTLDSYVRVFDSRGLQVAVNDDEAESTDSFLSFVAPRSGSYFIGVSGFGNQVYRPARAASGSSGSIGGYELGLDFGAAPARVAAAIRVMGFRDASDPRPALFAAYAMNANAFMPSARRAVASPPSRT